MNVKPLDLLTIFCFRDLVATVSNLILNVRLLYTKCIWLNWKHVVVDTWADRISAVTMESLASRHPSYDYSHSLQPVVDYGTYCKKNTPTCSKPMTLQPLDLSLKSHIRSSSNTDRLVKHPPSTKSAKDSTDVPLDLRITSRDISRDSQQTEEHSQNVLSALGLQSVCALPDFNNNDSENVSGKNWLFVLRVMSST